MTRPLSFAMSALVLDCPPSIPRYSRDITVFAAARAGSRECLVLGVTDRVEWAGRATWFPRNTDLPAEMNHLMREQNPFLARNCFHEILFDLRGLGVLC